MAFSRSALYKKLALAVGVTIAFFAALELVLGAAGWRPVAYEDDPYVGFSSWSPLFVEDPGAGASGRLVTAPNKLRLFNPQSFTKAKGDGVVRIFCLGGSTTYGRPYDDATSFCGWLRELLPAADPSRSWELINAGGISFASYRVAMLMEELVAYEPDIFIIYSGHNEFLEARTYARIIAMPEPLRGLGALAARTRTHAAMSALLHFADEKAGDGPAAGGEVLLDDEVVTLLDNSVGPDAYSRDDEQRDRTLEHFRFNLMRMVDIADSSGAATILVAPASNLRDCTPFKSEHREGLEADERARWQQLVAASRRAFTAGDAAAALAFLDDAVAIDPRHAHTQYLRGKVLDALGRPDQARIAYERARDEDVCPLRALSPVSAMVAAVAADTGATLVDFPAAVTQHAKDGIAGRDLFLDHVHPTIGGNRLMALSISGAMGDAGLLRFADDWTATTVSEIARRVEQTIDAGDHGLALMKLSKVLGWAGKLDEAHALAMRAVELIPDSAGAHYQAGLTADLLGLVERSMVHYRKAVELDPGADLPHGNLGVALEKQGDIRSAVDHYRAAFEHATPGYREQSRSNLATGLAKLGMHELAGDRIEEAAAALEEADQLLPGDWRILSQLAEARLRAGEVEEAIETLEKAVARRPEDARLHNQLAVVLASAGRLDEAAQAFRTAVDIDPEIVNRPESLSSRLAGAGRTKELAALRAALAP